MAEGGGGGGGHESTSLSDVVNSVVEKVKDLPAAHKAQNAETLTRSRPRLFSREKSVHQLLGGNKVADVMLWRDKKLSAGILAGSSIVYALFEWLGFHVLHVLSISLLFAFATLFAWTNAASLLKRSPPPIPKIYLSEDTAIHCASVIKDETNKVVNMLQEVVLGKDIKLFVKVELALWALALIGRWCDFLTLLYIGLLLSLSMPVVYDKYEDRIDHALEKAFEQSKKLHRKFCDEVWSKIPHLHPKDKKTQ